MVDYRETQLRPDRCVARLFWYARSLTDVHLIGWFIIICKTCVHMRPAELYHDTLLMHSPYVPADPTRSIKNNIICFYPLDLNSFFAWCSHCQGGLACEVCIKCKQRAETWERRRASQPGAFRVGKGRKLRFRSAAVKSEMRHSDVSRRNSSKHKQRCLFLFSHEKF